ncbi:response regulator [Agarilytica rhodophyticola]|uniref:response regulator n=1 Tax=Agarilytica rhodophyticola TaxID=1737490 RepID=UPI000B3411E1|nr:response regulator [Agarilytica rhodophyticola]
MNPLLNQDPKDLKQIDIVKIYSNKKCLVIDDFPEIRGSLSRTLKTFGAASVDTAADGEDAIKLCSSKGYDIVICDYNLGNGKDGQQVLEEVRFLRVLMMTSLFVMITGESSRHMVLGALECQPDDYITKPYTEASLKLRLNKAIIRHESLLHIKSAISKGDYRDALDECNRMIAEGHRYAPDCLKMKGQLHFLLKQMKEASKVYESVLGKKPVIWAKLGMAKTQIAMGHFDTAEKVLNEIIAEDERYVEAHDMLAEVHSSKGDLLAAQNCTASATKISPKSILRHRKLADLAEQNHDDEVALKSHQQSIKWGLNSCHESEQDYFNYARKVSDVVKGDDSSDSKNLAKNASTFLERARKRYSSKPEVMAQAQMVETQLHSSQGNEAAAQKSHDKAKKMFQDLASPPIEASLEFARSLHAMDEEEEARELLTKLAARHEGKEDIMRVIDGITGEPITEAGKKVASGLTKKGIGSYESKDFDAAINVFSEALVTYPKHVGLNLNLVQAIISQAQNAGFNEKHEAIIKRCLRAVGNIGESHKQYKRYSFLTKQLAKHYPDALLS